MTHARLLSETAIDRNEPRSAVVGDRLLRGQLPVDVLASLGYYPVDESTQPTVPATGFHNEPRYAYDNPSSPSSIVRTWAEVEDPPAPPAVYSKLKILLAAREAGFLTALISMIEADPETKWIWDASNTIEDNELLAAYLPDIAQALGRTTAELKAFLDENCLAE